MRYGATRHTMRAPADDPALRVIRRDTDFDPGGPRRIRCDTASRALQPPSSSGHARLVDALAMGQPREAAIESRIGVTPPGSHARP